MHKFDLQNLNLEQVPPKVLKQILEDAILMEQVSNRVYELLRDDLKKQRERKYGYGSRF